MILKLRAPDPGPADSVAVTATVYHQQNQPAEAGYRVRVFDNGTMAGERQTNDDGIVTFDVPIMPGGHTILGRLDDGTEATIVVRRTASAVRKADEHIVTVVGSSRGQDDRRAANCTYTICSLVRAQDRSPVAGITVTVLDRDSLQIVGQGPTEATGR